VVLPGNDIVAIVKENRRLNEQTAVLTLHAPEIAASAQPGQFVNLSCPSFLRRPIGVMARDRQAGTIQTGIRIQGSGTAWLAGLQPGAAISCLGPLGHGFAISGWRRVITVGGGTGIFPLYFVHQACREAGIESLAICGFRSRAESFLLDEYATQACQCVFASDCGGLDVDGHAGLALRQLLVSLPDLAGTAVLACGPHAMMQAAAALASEYGLPCQVSLEERMACGIGVCLVCACKTRTRGGGQAYAYQRCCADGPVFAAEDVVWPT
jgi:dihydroorotate dehydrogenase electron transfer subunit